MIRAARRLPFLASLAAVSLVPGAAQACLTSESYGYVFLKTAPKNIPEGASVVQVRMPFIDESLPPETGVRAIILSGKDRGKEGTVKQVLDNDRLIVEGVQIVKKHVRATQQGQQAGIVSTEAPIHRSNVMVIDPETKQPTRVGITVKEEARDGKVKTVRVRVAKKSGKELA